MNWATVVCQGMTDRALLQQVVGVRESRRLYRGSLASLLAPGIAEGTGHLKIRAAHELVKRALREELGQRCALSSPGAVREYLRVHFANREYEAFVVLFLDAQNTLIAAEEMFRGTLTQTAVYPREVVKAALRNNAAGVILAHNHPSGCATPSRADEQLTTALKGALALVDVRVFDHIIVAAPTAVSLAELGLL